MNQEQALNPHGEPRIHGQVRVPTLRLKRTRTNDKDKSSVSSRSKDSGSSNRGYRTRAGRPVKDDQSNSNKSSSYRSTDYGTVPKAQLENSYQMEPPATFSARQAEVIMQKILSEQLDDFTYDGLFVGLKTKVVSDAIKDQVKKLELPRFKLIAWVMICQRGENNLRVASRGLWDTSCDSYASVNYENQTLQAVANVYAIYQE